MSGEPCSARGPCSQILRRTRSGGSRRRRTCQSLDNSVGSSGVIQGRPPIEFPVTVRAVLVDVVQEELRSLHSWECVAPMSDFGSAVQHAIARLERDAPGGPVLLNPHGPDGVRLIADANRDAYFTRRPIQVQG